MDILINLTLAIPIVSILSGCEIECYPPHTGSIVEEEYIVVTVSSPAFGLALCHNKFRVYHRYHLWNEGKYPGVFPKICYLK